MKSTTLTTCVLIALAALLTLPAAAADRVAQLSAVTGDVSITRAETGTVDLAKQLGPRVRNGSVFAGDVVATSGSATATMEFSDGTQVKLQEGTSLSVREVDFTKLVEQGQFDKPIGRVIKIMAGNIWTNVVPNPEVATEFETPSGVAAVKGTTLTISVDPEAATE